MRGSTPAPAKVKVWLSPSLVDGFEYQEAGSSAWTQVVAPDGRLSSQTPLAKEICVAVETIGSDASWAYLSSGDGQYRCSAAAVDALPAVDERCFLSGTADITLLDAGATLCDQMQLLRERFKAGTMYTRVGPIETGTLISINPCTGARIGGAEGGAVADGFVKRTAHLFGTLAAALLDLKTSGRSQAVVFTGESGSGKTFAASAAVDFLVRNSAGGAGGGAGVDHKIRAATSLLHAFCQAPTSANENASRGGCATRLFFEADGTLAGASFELLPLALDAVARDPRSTGHVAALPSAMRVLLQLVWASPLSTNGALGRHLAHAGITSADLQRSPWVQLGGTPGRRERVAGRLRTDWLNTRENLDALGIGDDERTALLRTLVAAVCLGNVRSAAEPSAELAGIASLLSVSAGALQTCLGRSAAAPTRRRTAALATTLYRAALAWLVRRINAVLKPIGAREGGGTLAVDLIELAGYERRAGGGRPVDAREQHQRYEQLCTNYAAERMQAFVRERSFERPRRLYRSEGIELGFSKSAALWGGLNCASLFSPLAQEDGASSTDGAAARASSSLLGLLRSRSETARAEAAALDASAAILPDARINALSTSLVESMEKEIPRDAELRIFWQPGPLVRSPSRGDAAAIGTFYVAHATDSVKSHDLARHSAMTRYSVSDFVRADAAVDTPGAVALLATSTLPWLRNASAISPDTLNPAPFCARLIGELDTLFTRLNALHRVRFVRCLRSNATALRSTLDPRELSRQLASLELPLQRLMVDKAFPAQMTWDEFVEWCRPLHPADALASPQAMLLLLRDHFAIAPSAMRHHVRVGRTLVCMKPSFKARVGALVSESRGAKWEPPPPALAQGSSSSSAANDVDGDSAAAPILSPAEIARREEVVAEERHELQWRQSLAAVGAVDHGSPDAAWGDLVTEVSLFENLFPNEESSAGAGAGGAAADGGSLDASDAVAEWSVEQQRALHYNEQQLELARYTVEKLVARVRSSCAPPPTPFLVLTLRT